ncbi:MAG: SGNH/GDSL hydrolase family protein [candidate division Zixibacteria bacterium]|nr:SGNH/GDSL hydrolase family protein [candidate division Zixibacteria bacterium]
MTEKHPTRRFGWKALFLVLSIPAFILFSEIVLTIIPVNTFFENRFFIVNRALDYPEVFKKDRDLLWRFRPSQEITSRFFEGETIRINSFGLRGDEIPPRSDKCRIVALGNSCTFGWGMKEDQTYANRLEMLVNADSTLPEIEVINAGIPGYSSTQGSRFFYSDILKLHPDIVMLMFGWNDQWAASENISDRNQKMPAQFVIDLQNTFSRLKAYRLIRKIILWATEKPLEETLHKDGPIIYRAAVGEFYQNGKLICSTARKENVIPILLTSPIPALNTYYPPGMKSPMHDFHEKYNSQARLLANDLGVPLVDLARIFDGYDDLFDNAADDPIHFNAKGHRIAAEAIYKYLLTHPESLTSENSQ